jgi:hypothetical protein
VAVPYSMEVEMITCRSQMDGTARMVAHRSSRSTRRSNGLMFEGRSILLCQ